MAHTKPNSFQMQKDIFSTFCCVCASVFTIFSWLCRYVCGWWSPNERYACLLFMLCGRQNYVMSIHLKPTPYKLSAIGAKHRRQSTQMKLFVPLSLSLCATKTFRVCNSLPVHKSFSVCEKATIPTANQVMGKIQNEYKTNDCIVSKSK